MSGKRAADAAGANGEGSSSKKRKVAAGSSASAGSGSDLSYLSGFGNGHASEALPNALPRGQNNPQRCPYKLYAEQLSGSAFTKPRAENVRSWLYRIRPSVQHAAYEPYEHKGLVSDFSHKGAPGKPVTYDPNQMRWMPLDMPGASESVHWVDGLKTMGGAGEPAIKHGYAVHYYTCNTPMGDSCMTNADGDFLIVPQEGALRVRTEFGVLCVEPTEIVVVQRGMRFAVDVEGASRGYVLEIFKKHFQLPDLGPIGANGLANPQDFKVPVAAYEMEEEGKPANYFRCFTKFGGEMFLNTQSFSPFNVVAWRGNYTPYKYDLKRFCCMNTVTYDHPDPSIYTVLTCQSDDAGVAVADFVIFPPRWMVMEHTFRPPYYHRNTMTEFMGMIYGEYDAKAGGKGKDGKATGFVPGGASLHSCMTPHGPDAKTFAKATARGASDKPVFFSKGLAFMFESAYMMKLTQFALDGEHRDKKYQDCWASLPRNFDGKPAGGDEGEDGDHILSWVEAKK